MLKIITIIGIAAALQSCDMQPSSDERQHHQQERILQQATSSVGMPVIVHFREKRLLKDILELRDQEISTYTYIVAANTGQLVFLGESIGYGVPAATQFTNPQQLTANIYNNQPAVIAQADPNGSFSPASAEGTWVMMKDPNGTDVKPVYVEPRVIVSPFKLQ